MSGGLPASSLSPEATCLWLRASQAHIPIRGPTTAAAPSLPVPGIEPRRPVPRPPQPGSQERSPASFRQQRTPPPSRAGKSPPDARLEGLFPWQQTRTRQNAHDPALRGSRSGGSAETFSSRPVVGQILPAPADAPSGPASVLPHGLPSPPPFRSRLEIPRCFEEAGGGGGERGEPMSEWKSTERERGAGRATWVRGHPDFLRALPVPLTPLGHPGGGKRGALQFPWLRCAGARRAGR